MQVSAFQLHSNGIGHSHGHSHSSSALVDGGTPAENRIWAQARKNAIAQLLEVGIALHRHASAASAPVHPTALGSLICSSQSSTFVVISLRTAT